MESDCVENAQCRSIPCPREQLKLLDRRYGGIEVEYDTPNGSIITSVHSGSASGEHVFEVPMFDPEKMPSSAGGFPWKADGDFRTVVYIKNETDVARKITALLT